MIIDYKMARRSEHSQKEIKEMVLCAAENIVDEEGFAELKVRKVAMEIGYTVGSIYMVFDNMADLIMQVKGRTLDEILVYLTQAIDDTNADQSVALLAQAYLLYASNNMNRWSMIFEHRLTENDVVPDWYQEKVNEIFNLVELQFQHISQSCSKEQSKLASRALWSGVHGICILSLTGKFDLVGVDNTVATVDLLVDTFIKGWKSS